MPLEFGRKHGVLLMVVAVQVAASGTVRAADTRNKAEVPIIAIESKGAVRIAEDGVLEERLVLPVELGASDTIISMVTTDPDLVFDDGFESSNTISWSSTVP